MLAQRIIGNGLHRGFIIVPIIAVTANQRVFQNPFSFWAACCIIFPEFNRNGIIEAPIKFQACQQKIIKSLCLWTKIRGIKE